MAILNNLMRFIPRDSYRLYVDVSHCMLKCQMCPRGDIYGLQNPDKGLMSLDVFKSLVDKFADERVRMSELYVGNWGEPLLNPDLSKMIVYAKSHPTAMAPKANILVNTTLNRMPSPLELLESGVNTIVISMSGMTQDIYSINHKGGNIEKVIKNIEKLAETRSRGNIKNVKLKLAFHPYNYNKKDEELAKMLCQNLGIHFTVINPSIASIEEAIKFSTDKERMIEFYSKFIDLDRELPLMKTMSHDKIKDCRLLKKTVTVNFNTELYRCCGVYEKKHMLGSVFDYNIKDIPNIKSDICIKCANTPISWRP